MFFSILFKKYLQNVSIKIKSGDDLLSRSIHRNSTISAGGLNFSVRNGKRCIPVAIVTRK